MSRKCPHCGLSKENVISFGQFIRRSDKAVLKRYRCTLCLKSFSDATTQACYKQKKRRFNPRIFELLCSGVSQRRIARLLKLNRITVYRKFIFLATQIRLKNKLDFEKLHPILEMQFDDLETIEHTKLKPLSVTLAVEKHTRKILGFKVSRMPAKGLLAKKSRRKYGPRPDERPLAREALFQNISHKICKTALIESDKNPHYTESVRRHFPLAHHQCTKGQRGCVAGQGELKKIRFDPLFSLNHTFAMLRANINRLFRKTWCTTKLPERLTDHLELYVYYHNNNLIKPSVD